MCELISSIERGLFWKRGIGVFQKLLKANCYRGTSRISWRLKPPSHDRCPLSRSLLGVKRTWPFAPHMSAYDPKRTLVDIDQQNLLGVLIPYARCSLVTQADYAVELRTNPPGAWQGTLSVGC